MRLLAGSRFLPACTKHIYDSCNRRHIRMKRLLLSSFIRFSSISLLMATTGFGGCESPAGPFEGPGLHVLFVGNSLTYVNNLPGTIAAIATLDGTQISYESIANPDFALVDHLDGGSNAVSEIQRGGWNYVILQQGPSSLPESRTMLIDGTQRFNTYIRAAGARAALYMVWPSRDRLSFFEDVRLSYKLAADTVKGIFLPAGEAWTTAWQVNPGLSFYASDDVHPSPLGTFLAALVIYERVTGRDLRNLPSTIESFGTRFNASEETVRLLLQAAHDTNARYTLN